MKDPHNSAPDPDERQPIRSSSTRAWLFVRGPESVRLVVEGRSVSVYGPGHRYDVHRFNEELDATLYQAALEPALVAEGWTLERLTTERRSSPPAAALPVERRRHLRLVDRTTGVV